MLDLRDAINSMPIVETHIEIRDADGRTKEIAHNLGSIMNLALTIELPDVDHLQDIVDVNLDKFPYHSVASTKVDHDVTGRPS